jgi:hypothetical protein
MRFKDAAAKTLKLITEAETLNHDQNRNEGLRGRRLMMFPKSNPLKGNSND